MEKLLMSFHSWKKVCFLLLITTFSFYACHKSSDGQHTPKWKGAVSIQDSIKINLPVSFNPHGRYYRMLKDSRITDDNKDFKFYQVYSYSYKKTGEHRRAMELLNKAVELDPKEALGYRAWSMLYYYRNYEKSIADIDTLIALTNDCMVVSWGESCLYNKALALYKLKKYTESLEVFDQWKRCEEDYGFNMDDNVFYYFYTGRCFHKLGQLKKAVGQYKKAIKYEQSYNSEYNYYLALAYYELGKKELACTMMHEVLDRVKNGNKFMDPYIELFDEIYEWMPKEKINQWGC